MSDPLDTLIRSSPTEAIVNLPTSAAAGYDPDTTYALPAEPDPEPTVDCLFHQVTEAELLSEYEATASFRTDDFPGDVAKTGEATIVIDGVDYKVVGIRKRFWKGVQNGWTCELKR